MPREGFRRYWDLLGYVSDPGNDGYPQSQGRERQGNYPRIRIHERFRKVKKRKIPKNPNSSFLSIEEIITKREALVDQVVDAKAGEDVVV